MIIRKTKVNNTDLTGPERRNLTTLQEAIIKLEEKEEFKNTIGAMVIKSPEGSALILSAFSNDHLHAFLSVLMIELRNEELGVAYSDKNDEHQWAPVWSNRITLNYVN